MNHYLKLLSSAVLVGGISVVAAESAKPFSGPYIGIGTGYSIFNGRSISNAGGVDNKKQLHSQGFIGKIFAGYEALSVSNIYGGVEGYFLLDPQNSTYSVSLGGPAYTEKFSRKIAFGLRGKLGGSITDSVILYGILGGEGSQFTLNASNSSNKKKKTLWAAVPGVGMSVALGEKTKLLVEYTYSRYQVFSSAWTQGISSYSFKVRPSLNTISVGVSRSL